MRLFFALVFIRFFFFFFNPLFRTIFWSDCFWFQTFRCQMSAGQRVSLCLCYLKRGQKRGWRKTLCRSHTDGQVSPKLCFSFFFFSPPHYQEKTFCLGSRRKQHHNGRFHSSKESTKWNTERSLCQLNTYQCILTALQISSRSMNGVLFKWALLFS